MGSIDTSAVTNQSHFDVLIIGAGVSGINAAYRVHSELPDYSYGIIEARDAVGGTWDLFRYPGIRYVRSAHMNREMHLANHPPTSDQTRTFTPSASHGARGARRSPSQLEATSASTSRSRQRRMELIRGSCS